MLVQLMILTEPLSLITVNPYAYFFRGFTKNIDEEYEVALDDFNRAIEIFPDYTDAYLNRGIARYNLGLIDGACADWLKVKSLGSDEANDHLDQYCKGHK